MRSARTTSGISRCIALGAVALLIVPLLCACDYGRMREDEALRTYERQLPNMPERTIPVSGGIETLRHADLSTLENPVPAGPEAVKLGAERYTYYCIQCHGPGADGHGTVGQSFEPLPSDLTSPGVLNQSDGELYAKTYLGYKRHPILFDTLADTDGWVILHYLRSLATQKPRG